MSRSSRAACSSAPASSCHRPPNARNSSYQPWERLQGNDLYGALRFEHDIVDGLTGFLKAGARRSSYTSLFLNQNIIDYNGNITTLSAGQYNSTVETLSLEMGVRASFRTCPVKHEMAMAADYMKQQNFTLNNALSIPTNSNIYNPVVVSAPNLYGLSIGSPPLTSDSVYSSFGLVDSISFAGDMFQLIGGARAQQLQTANYSTTTGLPTIGNNQTVISPSSALVFKPRKELMLYTNYIQALQQGPIAGAGLTNAGQQFPPFVSTQYEVGAKVDLGTFGMTLSAFQITIPSSYTDVSTNSLVTTASSATKVSSSWPSASRSKG